MKHDIFYMFVRTGGDQLLRLRRFRYVPIGVRARERARNHVRPRRPTPYRTPQHRAGVWRCLRTAPCSQWLRISEFAAVSVRDQHPALNGPACARVRGTHTTAKNSIIQSHHGNIFTRRLDSIGLVIFASEALLRPGWLSTKSDDHVSGQIHSYMVIIYSGFDS